MEAVEERTVATSLDQTWRFFSFGCMGYVMFEAIASYASTPHLKSVAELVRDGVRVVGTAFVLQVMFVCFVGSAMGCVEGFREFVTERSRRSESEAALKTVV